MVLLHFLPLVPNDWCSHHLCGWLSGQLLDRLFRSPNKNHHLCNYMRKHGVMSLVLGARKISEVPSRFLVKCYAKYAKHDVSSEVLEVNNIAGSSFMAAATDGAAANVSGDGATGQVEKTDSTTNNAADVKDATTTAAAGSGSSIKQP